MLIVAVAAAPDSTSLASSVLILLQSACKAKDGVSTVTWAAATG